MEVLNCLQICTNPCPPLGPSCEKCLNNEFKTDLFDMDFSSVQDIWSSLPETTPTSPEEASLSSAGNSEVFEDDFSLLDFETGDNSDLLLNDIKDLDLFPNTSSKLDNSIATEPIKSDCMWSSASNTYETEDKSSLYKIESNLEAIWNTHDFLAPSSSSFDMLDDGLTADGEETDEAEEEEIDVESTEDRPRVSAPPASSRSLLVRNNQRIASNKIVRKRETILESMNNDHCYFSYRPVEQPATKDSMGILTPTESEDESEVYSVMAGQNKRMVAKAVNALLSKERIDKLKANDVKFKFRMRFKSNSPQRSLLAVNHRNTNRRRSASRNRYCPSPDSPPPATPASSKKPVKKSMVPKTASEKCRETRDLHNSMERQRRVDLRKNFDNLKACVPDLEDLEKASKLNILNKSADYCRYLHQLEIKQKREKDRELQKAAALRRRLSQLQSSFSNGTRLSSGRLSLLNPRY